MDKETQKERQGLFDLNRSTTTPTGRPAHPQRYRGHTLTILEALAECGGMTTAEISDKTFLSRKLVYEYCRRGFLLGILDKKELWGWAASPYGLHVLDISTTTTTTTTTTDHTNTTLTPHYNHTNTTLKSQQLDISAFLARDNITEAAGVVVGVLADHYDRTGEKYRIFADEYELADDVGISLAEVRPTLAYLKQEGCIYHRKEYLGWKVGLKVAFVEQLKNR